MAVALIVIDVFIAVSGMSANSAARSWFLMQKGYALGKNAVLEILHSGKIKKVIDIASIVGLFMIGCLSSSYVKFNTILTFTSKAAAKVSLQSILDGMLPQMLPFAVVMGMYIYITKKGPKYLRIMVYTMILAVALTFLGII
jgi:PTS system mannose-specific IID component/D-glucosaminate-specific PTS system IID component